MHMLVTIKNWCCRYWFMRFTADEISIEICADGHGDDPDPDEDEVDEDPLISEVKRTPDMRVN